MMKTWGFINSKGLKKTDFFWFQRKKKRFRFLFRRNSFQSWFMWGTSFPTDRPCETCVNHNNGIWHLFGRHSWRIIVESILYFCGNIEEKFDVLERRDTKRRGKKAAFASKPVCFQRKAKKKKKKRRKDRREKNRKVYINIDFLVSWKKMKWMCFYTIHAHYRDTGPLRTE